MAVETTLPSAESPIPTASSPAADPVLGPTETAGDDALGYPPYCGPS